MRKRILKYSIFMGLAGIMFIGFAYIYFNNQYLYYAYRIAEKLHFSAKTMDKLHYLINEIDIIRPLIRPDLKESDVVDLILSRSDVKDISSQIERFKKIGFMKDSLKNWRQAKILIAGKAENIKYKLHGTSTAPLRKGGFSLKIKHDKSGLYRNNMRRFNLITSFDEMGSPTIAINRIASHNQLIAPFGRMVSLRINGVNMGLYYLVEDHKKDWMEKYHKITNYSIIKANDDWDKKIFGHTSELDLHPGNQELSGTSERSDIALGMFAVLAKAIKEANLSETKRLIDEDYMARFTALGAIFNDIHFITGDNIRYIYDFTKGKFYILYRQEDTIVRPEYYDIPSFNKMWFNSQGKYYNNEITHKLFRLLIRDGEFRARRDRYLWKFVSDTEPFFNMANEAFSENYPVVLNTNYPRRKYRYNEWLFYKRFTKTTELAVNYIEYAKDYVTLDSSSAKNILTVVTDSYQPVALTEIIYEDNEIEKTIPVHYRISANNLDADLGLIHKDNQFIIKETNYPIMKLKFKNLTTGKIINDQQVYFNKISHMRYGDRESMGTCLTDNGINYIFKDGLLKINQGQYEIKSDIVTPDNTTVEIAAGTVFLMDPQISILIRGNLIALGAADSPIIVKNNSDTPFGSFAVVGDDLSRTVIQHFKISGGGEALVEGIHITGQLAIHGGEVELDHIVVSQSNSDDGLNVKNGNIVIKNSIFKSNIADQIDLDFCKGRIVDSVFIGSGDDVNGDGLDVSGTKAQVTGNKFNNFPDKAISVGEQSTLLITDNKFTQNTTAIAVKDGSFAYSFDNTFDKNKKDYNLFLKKKFYNLPNLYIDKEPEENRIELVKGNLFVRDTEALRKLYFNE